MGVVTQDAQIEFWMTVGLLVVIAGVFFLFFYGWPKGGDPSRGGDPGGIA